MAAKRYTVDVNGTKETIQTYTVLGGGGAKGEGLRFRLTKGAKVELTDDDARNGPQGIKVRRIGDDLHIALPGSDVAKPDVVIQDFYKNNEGNQLIGRGADGQYHSYAVDKITTNLPATPEMSAAVITPWGKVTEAVAPVIATETVPTAPPSTAPVATEGAKMGTLGWVLGGVGVLGIAAAAGGGGGGGEDTADKPIKSVEATGNTNEGDAATFTVTLRNPGNTATTWRVTLGGDSAIADDFDASKLSFSNGVTYNAVAGTITVPANIASFTITVPTVQDTAIEANELIKLDVEGTAGAATIVDNDVQSVATVVATNGLAVVESQTLSYTVTLNAPSARTETYTVRMTGGAAPAATPGTDTGAITATNGVAYDAATGTLTVPPNVESFQVNILAVSDAQREGAENLRLTISDRPAVAGTITDNDASAVTLPGNSPTSLTEGASVVYQVGLLAASSVAESYAFSIVGTVSAADIQSLSFTNGVTYNAATGTINVPQGVPGFAVTVVTKADGIYEGAETLAVKVGSVVGQSVTVNEGDQAPRLTLSGPATFTEGSASTATYTVRLSAASGLDTQVRYTINSGTATVGDDLSLPPAGNVATTGTLTIAAGQTSGTFTVSVADDSIVEATENFSVALSAPVNATLGGTSSVTTTINDNDVQTVSSVIAGTPTTEGSTTPLVYTVNLSATSPVATSYAFTLTGSATAGTDYPAAAALTFSDGVNYANGRLEVPANVPNFTISVLSTQDTRPEGNETVIVNVGGQAATGTITDDDAFAAATITATAPVAEGTTPPANNLVYTVTLNGTTVAPQNLAFTLGSGTDTAGAADHGATLLPDSGVTVSGNTFVVPAGVASFKVNVPITQDAISEPDETLTLTMGTVSGTAHIDADALPVATLSGPAAAAESIPADVVTYTVTLDTASSQAVTVPITITGVGGADAADYTLSAPPVTIAAGAKTGTVSVTVVDDAVADAGEGYIIALAGSSTATAGAVSSVTATITDNDPPISVAAPGARIASLLDTSDESALVLVAGVGTGASIVYAPVSTSVTPGVSDSTVAALAFSASTSVEDLLAQQLASGSQTL